MVDAYSLEKKVDAILEGIEALRETLTKLVESLAPTTTSSRGTVETFDFSGTTGGPTTIPYMKDSLIPTLSAIGKLAKRGVKPTASAVASITKRRRNTESANLGKLAELGLCDRFRIGRKVIYPPRQK